MKGSAMFDSVLGRGLGAPGRPGFGAAVSVALHAFLLAVALVLSPSAPRPLPLPPIHLKVHLGPPPGPAGTRAPATPARPPPVLRPRTTPLVAQPLPTPKADDSPVQPDGPSQPGTGPGPGDDAVCQGQACGPSGTPGGDSPILFLGAEMVPPRLLSGPAPSYPAEAALARLGGTVLLRCAVTASGTVEACTVLKGAPLLDEAALQAVTARRYAPALYEGRPVSVWMVLPVRFVPP
jgi:periplasmic protein TonB